MRLRPPFLKCLSRSRGWALAMGLLLGVLAWHVTVQAEPPRAALVFLTASWCGSCREIQPVVSEVASEKGLSIITIDVDTSSAVEQARPYGIAISGNELPELYLYRGGRTTLLFTGHGYHVGHAREAETRIRGALGEGP